MRAYALMIAVVLGLCLARTGWAKSPAGPIVLDVDGGDTAFAVDPARRTAWWLKDTCRVALPLTADSTATRLLTEPKTDTVSLGNRDIRMTQQFRFDLEDGDATISIYSSVRGGWAAVPTKRDRACEASACRARTELPEC